MGKPFETAEYKLGKTFWLKRSFVLEKRTGIRHFSTQQHEVRLLDLMEMIHAVAKSDQQRATAIGLLLERYMQAVCGRGTSDANAFLGGDAAGIAANILATAHMLHDRRTLESFGLVFKDDSKF